MASILEKAISILAENLNSGRSNLITAVPDHFGITRLIFLIIDRSLLRLPPLWNILQPFVT